MQGHLVVFHVALRIVDSDFESASVQTTQQGTDVNYQIRRADVDCIKYEDRWTKNHCSLVERLGIRGSCKREEKLHFPKFQAVKNSTWTIPAAT